MLQSIIYGEIILFIIKNIDNQFSAIYSISKKN